MFPTMQIMRERNEAQVLAKTCMQEKANYRAQLRELEGRFDNIKETLLRTEKQLAHEKILSQQPSSYSSSSSQQQVGSSSDFSCLFKLHLNNQF